MQSPQILSTVLHGLMKKLYVNIIHYILRETDLNSWLMENYDLPYVPDDPDIIIQLSHNYAAFQFFLGYKNKIQNDVGSDEWLNAKLLYKNFIYTEELY